MASENTRSIDESLAEADFLMLMDSSEEVPTGKLGCSPQVDSLVLLFNTSPFLHFHFSIFQSES